jgi:chromosome segregation ATPase
MGSGMIEKANQNFATEHSWKQPPPQTAVDANISIAAASLERAQAVKARQQRAITELATARRALDRAQSEFARVEQEGLDTTAARDALGEALRVFARREEQALEAVATQAQVDADVIAAEACLQRAQAAKARQQRAIAELPAARRELSKARREFARVEKQTFEAVTAEANCLTAVETAYGTLQRHEATMAANIGLGEEWEAERDRLARQLAKLAGLKGTAIDNANVLRMQMKQANERVVRLKCHVNTLNDLALGKDPDNAASWLADNVGAPLVG